MKTDYALESFDGFPKQTLTFMRSLARNNRVEWFREHRPEYEEFVFGPSRSFVTTMGISLRQLAPKTKSAPKVGGSIFRINRDTRFSNDKTPYKKHLAFWFWEGAGSRNSCSGFYLHFDGKKLVLGSGIYGFEKPQLVKFRDALVDKKRSADLKKIVRAIERIPGYSIEGKSLKRIPRGYEASDEFTEEFLKHQGLFISYEVAVPKDLHSPKFIAFCTQHFRKMLPMQQWLVANVGGNLSLRAPGDAGAKQSPVS